jgi:nucleotide-binding universal stress UspA family protein
MELSISLETVCRIIIRAREYEAQVPAVDPDDGSNPTDDGDVEVLEDENNSAVEEELITTIDDLAEDEQQELLALALVGRGTYDATEWDDAMEAAADEMRDVSGYLLGLPMLSSFLEAGLAAFDMSCDDIGQVS